MYMAEPIPRKIKQKFSHGRSRTVEVEKKAAQENENEKESRRPILHLSKRKKKKAKSPNSVNGSTSHGDKKAAKQKKRSRKGPWGPVPSENLIRWIRSRKENRIMIETDGDLLQTSA